jgi:hypothetical protein
MPVSKDILGRKPPTQPSSERMLTETDLKILWISRTLTNIDFQYGEDVLNLDLSDIEIEQRNYIKKQLLLKYQQRRAPYQTLLESLRGYRESNAA